MLKKLVKKNKFFVFLKKLTCFIEIKGLSKILARWQILEEKITFEKMESDSITITQKTYSLLEVMLSIQSILHKNYGNKSFWVRCEIARISFHAQSGHCYLELIDKNESAVVAQQRGIIWSDRYFTVSEKFKAVTNTTLAGGMKVLLQCSVNFHSLHGFSLNVTDIEPSFTLGEMARMKNESITRLKAEGLFNLNKQLKLALIPQRVAIISVVTSRGYQDFISTINNHHKKFSFSFELFEATLQGENAVPTIINALKRISSLKEKFDAIVIIRGGAGDAGLACYDEYSLSSVIATSPLPVITGIGHATNETVVEMIAFKNCITPTAAATFLLDKFDVQSIILNELSVTLNELTKSFFTDEKNYLSTFTERFCMIVNTHLNRQQFIIQNLLAGLPAYLGKFFSYTRQNLNQSTQIKITSVTTQMQRNKDLLNHLTEKINLLDPVNTLLRGYSITRLNGKALTESSDVEIGMQIETELARGVIISTVK